MVITPLETRENADYTRMLTELLADESMTELTWVVKPGKRVETWRAESTAPDGKVMRYRITRRGAMNPVRVSYRAAGLPPKVQARQIASVESLDLALLCAEAHHRRQLRRFRVEAVEATG